MAHGYKCEIPTIKHRDIGLLKIDNKIVLQARYTFFAKSNTESKYVNTSGKTLSLD